MIIREKVRIGDQVVTLETGRIAKQAGGSVLVRAGDTIVLVTVCGTQEPKPGQSFFPLSVDYQEKTYAAGKIPGGFFKREGKLRDYEVLISRLIDRPCRPLFPEGYLSEVQVVATVMSFDQVNPPDTLAMIGASAALHISPIPWSGPIAGVRVGRVNGEFIANPTFQQMEKSDCELLVAASRDAIVMVEGEADEMSEADMIEALLFAHRSVQDTLELIDRMRQAVGKQKWSFSASGPQQYLKDRVSQAATWNVREACNIADKHARADRIKQIKKETVNQLAHEFPGEEQSIKDAFEELRYNTMRAQVLDEGRRLDGRDTHTVRPISIELGVLPRTHGSSLFTRGETQAIVTTTLGTTRDAQRLDTLQGDQHKAFMLHYNFPPYSVGEVKPMRGPGRREVGHGNLAERALAKVLPTQEEFPYALRIVSEITESNGSSSMASVCGGALALMDAGVPIKAPVAGVAMGLIKEGERYAVLTDILGDEDALGDMDFKVCGTEKGVTAIQMDIKIEGLSREILERALHQAREARLHILDKMHRAIEAPREELSQYAPRITQIRVKPDQVRTIIGPGGKMIRAIVDQTGASIDVADDGTVSVASADSSAVAKALEIIKSLTTEPEIGEVYEGTVKRIEPYGAFIEILPGKDGLCHISDMDWNHVNSVEDFVNLGDKVTVKVTNIDRDGRIRLSRKDALPDAAGQQAASKLNGRGDAREEGRGERRGFERGESRGRGREGGREERPAFRAREEREERPVAKAREERPAFKAREEREERKPRDFEREERPAFKAREEREERKPRDFEREERPAFKAREEREERPAFKAREEREERPALKAREERPAFKAREEREERPALKAREEREERKPRDFERDERPAFKAREERDERPALKAREERPAFKAREEREERPAFKAREEREERPAVKGRDFDREKPARREEEPRRERSPREERFERRDEKPRDLDRDASRRERAPLKARDDLDERPSRAREVERPARPRDEERGRERTREPERDERPSRTRDIDLDRPARSRDEERPSFAKPAARESERELGRGRARDFDRDEPAPRGRDLDDRAGARKPVSARGRDEELPSRAREERPRSRDLDADERPARSPARAGRDDERFESRSGRARSEDERPSRARTSDVPERPAARRVERFEEERDERFEERDAPTSSSDRDDRTERERPSRIRARARNRERVREAERERDRR